MGAFRKAFTLIELLVTMLVLLLLAGIALPVTKNVIIDQRKTRATQAIKSFIDSARNQAIAENREMGVMFERVTTSGIDGGASIQMMRLRGMPPYRGESTQARATLIHDMNHVTSNFPVEASEVNAALFDPIQNPLLLLSAQILADSNISDGTAPIQIGDGLELPGGRMVTIREIDLRDPTNELAPIVVSFYLKEPVDPRLTNSTIPYPNRPIFETSPPQRVRYAIHRRPQVAHTESLSLPRGTAIDLNYSGFGVRGNEFSPAQSSNTEPISIVFDSQGRVSRVQITNSTGPALVGQLFLCVGSPDGVRTGNLLANDDRARANVLRADSTWIVITPATGRVVSAPFASVSMQAVSVSATPVGDAIQQARSLAVLGDTLE